MKRSRDDARHRRIYDLLPWYANGTLDPGERRAVERHLEDCGSCVAELARCRELAAAVRAPTVPAPAPHPVQLRHLMARIDALPATGWRSRWRRLVRRPGPERLGTLFLLQTAVLLILVVGPHVRSRPVREPDSFRTLSVETTERRGPALRVVFADSATLAQIRSLLEAIDGQWVAGPSRHGVCTLTLGPEGEAERALARLRQSSAVVFAEPVEGEVP